MVFSALDCGCLQGLALQRSKSRAKRVLIEDEATSCHDDDMQAKIKAFHEAKQRQANEAKALQELDKAAKKHAAADSETLKHAELVGRLEKAKAEMEATAQPEAAKEAMPQLMKEGISPDDVRCLPLEDSNSSLVSTRIESPCNAEMEATKQPEAAKEAAPQLREGTSPEDVWCLPLEDSNLSVDNTWIETSAIKEMRQFAAEMEDKETPPVSPSATCLPQPREKYPVFEPAMEAASLKESSAKSPAPEDQLHSRTAAVAAKGRVGLTHKAVLAGCAVVVIAVLAFHATSWSS